MGEWKGTGGGERKMRKAARQPENRAASEGGRGVMGRATKGISTASAKFHLTKQNTRSNCGKMST